MEWGADSESITQGGLESWRWWGLCSFPVRIMRNWGTKCFLYRIMEWFVQERTLNLISFHSLPLSTIPGCSNPSLLHPSIHKDIFSSSPLRLVQPCPQPHFPNFISQSCKAARPAGAQGWGVSPSPLSKANLPWSRWILVWLKQDLVQDFYKEEKKNKKYVQAPPQKAWFNVYIRKGTVPASQFLSQL